MQPCSIRYIPIFILTTLSSPAITDRTSSESDIWRSAGKMTGLLLNECFRSGRGEARSPEQFLLILRECVKGRSLSAFDRTMAEDVIEILDGVEFVRYRRKNGTRNNRYLKLPWTDDKYDRGNDNWQNHVIRGVRNLLRTHVLKIRLTNLDASPVEGKALQERSFGNGAVGAPASEVASTSTQNQNLSLASSSTAGININNCTNSRGRRKNNMFTQMLMFGMVTAAIIVIPMGFQFLAILGGKALLLAKMALLLTAIQGLKKIATSNYNYGLYSTYGAENGPWNYDRQWRPDAEGAGLQTYGIPEGYSQILHPRREVVGDWQTLA